MVWATPTLVEPTYSRIWRFALPVPLASLTHAVNRYFVPADGTFTIQLGLSLTPNLPLVVLVIRSDQAPSNPSGTLRRVAEL